MTVTACLVCGAPLATQLAAFEERRLAAVHRQEHERQERRRATWRAYSRRRYALRRNPDHIGFLHKLSCGGQHRGKRNGCVPIPVYDHPVKGR